MEEEQLWPRDEVADVRKLYEFIDAEILTPEFTQGIDRDAEPELYKAIKTYRTARKQFIEAFDLIRKGDGMCH